MFDNAAPQSFIALDRRKFLGLASTLVAAGIMPKRVLALAGPFAFKQGTFDVTVVSDGLLYLPWSIVAPEAPPDEVKRLLGPALAADKTKFEANPVLVKAGSDVILFDTGSGQGFQPTSGQIAESLKMAGTDPGSVTKVVFTHAHPDHIWGTVAGDGKLNFPNAAYFVAEAEWNFWTAEDTVNKFPKEMQGIVTGAQKHLAGVKDRVTMFKPGGEIVTGISVLDTAGHTPGHVSFMIAGGEGLILTADALTVPAVFFPHPDWHFGFDTDKNLAATNRMKLLDQAATGKTKLLGYHWPYPGIAYAEKKDAGYNYVPAS
jgi:glyoxylase-like metal-dependent hydrolase (beta-lactamase superfamily II)